MMNGRQSGSPPPPSGLDAGPATPPPTPAAARLGDSGFGAPILFDLTAVRDEAPPGPGQAPVVYYLATLPPPAPRPFPWRTVVGFGGVVLGGVGLGLLLAALLLPL